MNPAGGAESLPRPGTTTRRPGLAARLVLLLLRGYKVFISPMFTGSCRFLPSCSDYAAEAVVRYGALRGSRLAIGRLLRCHPFCKAGHDPVPNLDS